jgi:hypothetical protein
MIWEEANPARCPRRPMMSETKDPPAGEDILDLVEVETEEVDEDGNIVVDDLVAAVDGDGNIVATDETIAVVTVGGDIVVDETFSVVGDDGELHAAMDDVTVLEADDEA